MMETLLKDLKYGFKGLLNRPGFSLIAIATLALAIGANTAIFSLVNTVLFNSLPVDHPEQVVSVAVRDKNDSIGAFSYPNYIDFRDHNDVLSGLLLYRFAPISLSQNGNNERVWSYEVTGNYFDLLGVHAIRGRALSPDDDNGKLAHPVVMLSYSCWQRRFGGDKDIIGKTLLLNSHSFEIIGVAPEGFRGTETVYTPELWAPLSMLEWIEPGAKWLDIREDQNLMAIGRIKPGVTVRQAESSLNILAGELAREYPNANEGQSIQINPPGFVIPELRNGVVSFAWALMGLVFLVLLIACANLAGLLLARATDRRREIAVRLAIGASRGRLIRQLLTESILLSIIGGIAGLGIAMWIVKLAISFRPPLDFPLTLDLKLDWRVMVFSFAASLMTGIIFGLAPALHATKLSLITALKETAAQAGFRRSRLRNSLIVLQLALSLALLTGAALVVGTLKQLATTAPGFDSTNALTLSYDLGLQGYDEARSRNFNHQLLDRVSALRGIRSVAMTTLIPLGLNESSNRVWVEGAVSTNDSPTLNAMDACVSTRYFETIGTPLLAGREFAEQDDRGSERVAVVNEAFVRKSYPDVQNVSDVIGRRVSTNSLSGPFMRIVGVVRTGKYFSISEQPRAFIWYPLAQRFDPSVILIARTTGDSSATIAAIRNEVRALDPTLPLFDVKTLTEHLRLALFPARVAASVLGAFGLVALLLAAIGIYGITSFSVAQRTREIGLRMALGAQTGDVLKLILKNGLALTLIGVAVGLIGATALTRLITSLLFGVTTNFAGTIAVVTGLLIAVTMFASYLPARRATKVDPLKALRSE